jgi:ubiquinone/menaquinone biosynthesis C-methylase UbiE
MCYGCEAMGLADETFDAAFSMFGVSLFRDWRAGLSEMFRVVRPGGTATLGTWEYLWFQSCVVACDGERLA